MESASFLRDHHRKFFEQLEALCLEHGACASGLSFPTISVSFIDTPEHSYYVEVGDDSLDVSDPNDWSEQQVSKGLSITTAGPITLSGSPSAYDANADRSPF